MGMANMKCCGFMLALLLLASNASAVPMRVDFTVVSTVPMYGDMPPAGVTGTGFFVFETPSAPGLYQSYTTGLLTLDLSFNWFGIEFDEIAAPLFLLDWDGQSLRQWTFGMPIHSFPTISRGTLDLYVNSLDQVHITFDDLTSIGTGRVTEWRMAEVDVPEPGTLGLFALGSTLLVVMRGSRRSRASV